MKQFLKKPLGLAAAITLALGGLTVATTASAAISPKDNAGDAAIVPYYTANAGFTTGLHIINTTAATQVVKIRMRRKDDSNDAIDFNIVMSPKDMFVGAVVNTPGGLAFRVNDNTCTVPAADANNLLFPVKADLVTNNVAGGATEGYMEIIGMAQVDDSVILQQISNDAVHTAGVPNNCDRVRENFFAPTTTAANIGGAQRGVVNSAQTATRSVNGAGQWSEVLNNYVDTPARALKVSYFIRHQASGLEFGNNAVHIEDFAQNPLMTNQQYGLINSLNQPAAPVGWDAGYDFPNLDGGSSANGGQVGLFNTLRAANVLGTSTIINDWSVKAANGVATDWTVTLPGQYLMRPRLTAFNTPPAGYTLWNLTSDDIPVLVVPRVFDREEGEAQPEGLVVSPGLATNATFNLTREVNVIEWFQQSYLPATPSVLKAGAPYKINDNPFDSAGFAPTKGWAELALTSGAGVPLVYNHATNIPSGATGLVPVVGFAAWQRNLNVAGAAYGRIVEHTMTAAQ